MSASPPFYVDKCEQVIDTDSLSFLSLVISSYSNALSTLRAISNSNNLREVWLEYSDGDQGVEQLCRETLFPNRSIERLRLDLRECSDRGIQHVADIMKVKHYTSISLLLNNVGVGGAGPLSEALAATNSLREFSIYATQLDLHDRRMGDEGVSILCGALKRDSCPLQSLCIAQNGVTKVGVSSILAALCATHSLGELDLHSNDIDSEGVLLISSHLSAAGCILRKLILDENNQIGNEGATSIAGALCVNKSLRVLSLRSCGIGRRGAERFAKVLSVSNTLSELSFCGNVEIRDDAVELVSRGLKGNRSLSKLDLSSCGVGDEGCAHLADALMENETLKTLLLHKNEIGDGGIMALSETLAKRS